MEKSDPPPYSAFNNDGYSSPPAEPSAPLSAVYPSLPTSAIMATQPPPSSGVPLTATHTNVVHVTQATIPGSCPVCHNKEWTGKFTTCGWLWCLCCFPCGLICCCSMKQKTCTKCGFKAG